MFFFKDKVRMCPHPAFLPNVVSQFHMSQDIYLPVFFPKSHASAREQVLPILDVRSALVFCIERTKEFHKSPQLFISIAERMKGLPVSAQCLSSWITFLIKECYDSASRLAPPLLAHSTKVQLTSTPFLAQVPILDI